VICNDAPPCPAVKHKPQDHLQGQADVLHPGVPLRKVIKSVMKGSKGLDKGQQTTGWSFHGNVPDFTIVRGRDHSEAIPSMWHVTNNAEKCRCGQKRSESNGFRFGEDTTSFRGGYAWYLYLPSACVKC
jgi:hypothetical protein